jgi:hypothetical protein
MSLLPDTDRVLLGPGRVAGDTAGCIRRLIALGIEAGGHADPLGVPTREVGGDRDRILAALRRLEELVGARVEDHRIVARQKERSIPVPAIRNLRIGELAWRRHDEPG